MGFTVSHMAAVLPFYRQRWLSFDALLIGSVLPDLPYFLAQPNFVVSHQWIGLFSYCLPWGMAVFVLWCWLFKPACVALLSPWYPVNLNSYPNTIKAWLIYGVGVVAGLLIGASTHLIWDGITHADGFIASHSAVLQQTLQLTLPQIISGITEWTVSVSMPLTRFLQYFSSVVGLLYLFWFVHSQMRIYNKYLSIQPTAKIFPFKKWHSLLIIVIVGLGSLFSGLQAVIKWHSLVNTNHYLFVARILVSMVQSGLFVLLIYALIYKLLSMYYAK